MLKTIKTAVISAFVGIGTLAAIPATAHADSLYLGFGGGNSRPGVEFFVGEERGYSQRADRRHYRRDCTPERALDKAERMGLRRVYVRNVNPNRIRVEGRDHGDRVRVTFAREPGCPVIRVR